MKNKSIEQTLVIIKGDGVQRGIAGEIITRFEKVGLKLKAMKMVWPNNEMINKHYDAENKEWLENVGIKAIKGYEKRGIKIDTAPIDIGLIVQKNLLSYFSAGPVIAIVLEGSHAIEMVRKIVGPTDPFSAAPGTIRGDYSMDSFQMSDVEDRTIRNLIHASGDVEDAKKEIEIWFDKSELHTYIMPIEEILYSKDWEKKQAIIE
ncbi:nucleoside-diphosphate kinase [Patescibacteria group bacterium]